MFVCYGDGLALRKKASGRSLLSTQMLQQCADNCHFFFTTKVNSWGSTCADYDTNLQLQPHCYASGARSKCSKQLMVNALQKKSIYQSNVVSFISMSDVLWIITDNKK